ncbi:hypothetical protein ABZ203_23615, partial [Streptomyces albidoflavus]|uniref:hypothetical protein n=1 Tax=Streptomyces albidoflavus TaxID=1886 RepID=UPI0033B41605
MVCGAPLSRRRPAGARARPAGRGRRSAAACAEPYLSYVLHEDEERIDGLKALLGRIDPPEPV